MNNGGQQPSGLISVLLDQSAEFGARDDAAMDLGAYDGSEVEEALLKVVLDHLENDDLVDSAVESLAEVWLRSGYENPDLVEKMHPVARRLLESET